MELEQRTAQLRGTHANGRPTRIAKHCRIHGQVLLKREPNNKHDPNAIRIYATKGILFGLLGNRHFDIGMIPAGTAKSLAKKMDAEHVTSLPGRIKYVWVADNRRSATVSIIYPKS